MHKEVQHLDRNWYHSYSVTQQISRSKKHKTVIGAGKMHMSVDTVVCCSGCLVSGVSRLYRNDPNPCVRQIASACYCIGTVATLLTAAPILRQVEITIFYPQGIFSCVPIFSGCGKAMRQAACCIICHYALCDDDRRPPTELGHAHPMHGERMDRV